MEHNVWIPSQPPISFKTQSNLLAKRTLRPLTARRENAVQPIPFTKAVILPTIIPVEQQIPAEQQIPQNDKLKQPSGNKIIYGVTLCNVLLFLATAIACTVTLLMLLRGKVCIYTFSTLKSLV